MMTQNGYKSSSVKLKLKFLVNSSNVLAVNTNHSVLLFENLNYYDSYFWKLMDTKFTLPVMASGWFGKLELGALSSSAYQPTSYNSHVLCNLHT